MFVKKSNTKFLRIILVLAFLISFSQAKAQSLDKIVLASDGKNFTNSTLQLSYTFGETFTNYYSAVSFNLSLGFQGQQFNQTAFLNSYLIDNELKIYPNPSVDFIKVESNNEEIQNISIRNLLGQLIFNCNDCNNIINISSLSTATYYITVITNKTITTQKIIKL